MRAFVRSQLDRLSKYTPPLQDVPVVHSYIHAGSKVITLAKSVTPSGHIWAWHSEDILMHEMDMKNVFFIAPVEKTDVQARFFMNTDYTFRFDIKG